MRRAKQTVHKSSHQPKSACPPSPNTSLAQPVACPSRRVFLRSATGLLALPWLESLTHAAEDNLVTTAPANATPTAAVTTAAPARFAFLYTPNGYRQDTFVPQQTGSDWELPPALEPLAPIQAQVTLVTGLDRQFVPGTGVHAQCGSCWLTSSPPQETRDGGFPTNTTLDQFLARHLGRETPFPSLELSCNDFTNNKETRYFESISWYGPGHAANTEKNPRALFARLFGQPDRKVLHRSVLDKIQVDAKRLHAQLAVSDQRKLDEYLTSVRETERRIEKAEQAAAQRQEPPLAQPTGIPDDRRAYLRLMLDLLAFAFQLDRTRVATIVIDPERWDTPRMYHGVFDAPQNHHVLTHTKGPEAKEKLTRIDRFHVEQYAYLIQRLHCLADGTGNLLDHCLIAMGSGISDGDSHNYADLQVLLAGGLLPTKGHKHFAGQRPLADLWLTIGQTAGLDLPRFADSTGPLPELQQS